MITASEFIPPQSLDAEMSALGAMMLSAEAVQMVIERCRVEDFYRGGHRTLFDAMLAISDRMEPVDLVTVQEELQRRGELDKIGGTEYLLQLAEMVPSVSNAGYYAEIVRRKSMLRRLKEAAEEVEKLVHSDEDFDAVFDRAEQAIFSAGQRRLGQYFQHAKPLISEYFDQVTDLYENDKVMMGMPTRYPDLDRVTTGLYPGELTILAARPSVGKTALALHMAMNVALFQKQTVAFFSLEMPAMQLIQRMICSNAAVNSQSLRTRLNEDEFSRIHMATDRLYSMPLYIDDSSDVSSLEVLAKCRRLKSEHDLGLIVVDYLQLMRGGRRTENRVQEISEVARGLKRIAKDLSLPVIALSQLSRSVEYRDDKRPLLSDLRESGSIEAEADVVLLLYREAYYKRKASGPADEQEDDKEPEQWKSDEGHTTEKVEVDIAKNRNGPTAKITLAFQPEFARFLPLERDKR